MHRKDAPNLEPIRVNNIHSNTSHSTELTVIHIPPGHANSKSTIYLDTLPHDSLQLILSPLSFPSENYQPISPPAFVSGMVGKAALN